MDVRVSFAAFDPQFTGVMIGWAEFTTVDDSKEVLVGWAQFNATQRSITGARQSAPFLVNIGRLINR